MKFRVSVVYGLGELVESHGEITILLDKYIHIYMYVNAFMHVCVCIYLCIEPGRKP